MAEWTGRTAHLARHGVTVEQVEEALNDAYRLVFDPDPKSASGASVRTVGYSRSAGTVLCVVTVTAGGITYGATAFRANTTYQRMYKETRDG